MLTILLGAMPPKFKRPTKPVVAKVKTNVDEGDEDAFFSRNTKGWDGVDFKTLGTPARSLQE